MDARIATALAILALCCPLASASRLLDLNNRHQQPGDTEPALADSDIPTEAEPFGRARQQHLTITGFSTTFSVEATDVALGLEWSRFLADDFQWIVEGRVLHSNQPGDNVLAGNFRMLFRYHAINRDTWTAFADIGVGLLIATDDVPADGTDFNFTPTVGVGATWQLPGSAARLVGGIRWHHISNARIDDNLLNPSRDDIAVFLGVSWRI